MNITKIVIFLLFVGLFYSQTCSQLCKNDCRNSSCQSCYANFMANALSNASCQCPTGLYKSFNSNSHFLCLPCHVTCQSCSSYSNCTTCIPGFILHNSFRKCIPGNQNTNTNQWISKNVSLELYENETNLTNVVVVNTSSVYELNTYNINSFLNRSCSLFNSNPFLGPFNYQTKVIKNHYNLPPHDWINIRLQVFLGDSWVNNTLIVEIDRQESSLSGSNTNNGAVNMGLTTPVVLWSGLFDNSRRFINMCGSNLADSIVSIDVWTSHALSSSKIRIRLNESQTNTINSTSNLNSLNYGIRDLFVRVGTCGRSCQTCDNPSKCLKCRSPYTLVNGSCLCQAPNGLPSRLNGCQPKCFLDQFYNSTSKSCQKCQKVLSGCRECQQAQCFSCQRGFFYHKDLANNKEYCLKSCPSGTTQKLSDMTNLTNIYTNTTISRDTCTPCPSNCSQCISNSLCTLCQRGFIYQKGKCLQNCPQSFFISNGQCIECQPNCKECQRSDFCYKCQLGFMFDQASSRCMPVCSNDQNKIALSSSQTCNLTCSSSCQTCFGTGNNQCTSCSSTTTMLYQGSCVSPCPVSFYSTYSPASSSIKVCVKCNQKCSSCISSSICSACNEGYYLFMQKCLRSCPMGYHIQPADRTCMICPQGCLSCKSQSLCLRCNKNNTLFDHKCSISTPLDVYFDDQLGYFKSCEKNCEICSKELCFKCKPDYYLDQQNCVSQCSNNKYKVLRTFSRSFIRINTLNNNLNENITTGFCQWKSPLCSKYDQASLDGTCLKCSVFLPMLFKDPISQSNSIRLNQPNCNYNCPLYHFRNGQTCSPCPQNCRICTSATSCLECQYNYAINSQEILNNNGSAKICVLNYCEAQYFSDSNQCLNCPKGCQYCELNGVCSSCVGGYRLENGKCRRDDACLDGQYLVTSNSTCLACHQTCQRCWSASATSCISCKDTNSVKFYYLRSNYSCVTSCPQLFFFQHDQSRSCRACNPLCETCLSLTNCTTCKQGFYLLSFYDKNNAQCVKQCPLNFYTHIDHKNRTCIRCYEDCKSCYGPSEYQCLSCYGNFYLDDSKCVYTCSPGKYKDKNGHCDWCHPSCSDCRGPLKSDCVQCSGDRKFFSQGDCRSQCPGATYLAIPSQNICERCQFGCQFCQSPQFCDFCTPGYNLYKGWCYQPCPGDTVQTTTRFPNLGNIQGYICGDCLLKYSNNCLSCDGQSCSRCKNGLYLHRISTSVILQDLVYVKEQCLSSCPSGFFPNSRSNEQYRECVPCRQNCELCSSFNECTKCKNNLISYNGYCSSSCPQGFYYKLGGNCTLCPSRCRTCVSQFNCTSCNMVNNTLSYLFFNISVFTCVSTCPSGYFNENGVCLRCLPTCSVCTSANTCVQCLFGLTLLNGICVNITTTPVVIPCPTNCLLCNGNNCLKCVIPFILSINPTSGFSTCSNTCQLGYYPSVQSCLSCNSTCLSCVNSANNCTACRPGLFLHQRACISTCNQGYYGDMVSLTCKECSVRCNECLSSSLCLKCQNGFYFFNESCHERCPLSTYLSLTNNQCYNCGPRCLSCQNAQNCTSCLSIYKLFNGKCVINCPQTTYLYKESSSQSICAACISPCYTCLDQKTCTTCIPNYVLNRTTCQQSCNEGYFLNITYTNYMMSYQQGASTTTFNNYYSCLPCQGTCLSCLNKSTNCLRCIPGYVLFNNDCISRCPLGTYQRDNRCLPCSRFCGACENSDDCIFCKENTFYYKGNCQPQCPSGTFAQNPLQSQAYCRPCHINCTTCTDLTAQNCTSCPVSKYLLNNTCLQRCPKGNYADNLTSSCKRCDLVCVQCFSNQNCISCISGYVLSSTNRCVVQNQTTVMPVCSVNNCFICNITNNQCHQCKLGFLLFNNTCVDLCPQKTYQMDKICLNCSRKCLKCNNLQTCLQCQRPSLLYLGKCYDQCPANTLLSTQFNNTCIPNPCIQQDRITNNCLLCSSPYVLAMINQTMRCQTSCPISTVQVDGKCINCSINCQRCLSQEVCVKCRPNSLMFRGRCVTVCPPGTVARNNQCQPCSTMYCQTCSMVSNTNLEQCHKCLQRSYRYLFNNTCYLLCPNQYYQDHSTMTCKGCPLNCLTCLNSTICRNCTSNFYLFRDQCVSNCPSGTYKMVNRCIPCNSSCLTCSDRQSCTTCAADYYFLPAIFNIGVSRCMTICPDGLFPRSILSVNFVNFAVTVSLYQECAKCNQPCLICKSSTICTSCITNHTLSGSLCIRDCPSGFFKQLQTVFNLFSLSFTTYQCKLCSSVCLTCVNTSSTCLSCHPGFILTLSNDCVSNCSLSTSFYNSTLRSCLNCSSNCFSCFGPNANNCLSCKIPLQLYQGTCYTTCPFGFFNSPTYRCQPCSMKCASCSSSALNCTSCDLPNYLQVKNNTGSCIRQCSQGYYLNTTMKLCVRCHNSCLTCSGQQANKCLKCSSTLNMVNGQCKPSCPSGTANIISANERYCKLCPTGCRECFYNPNENGLVCTLCSQNLYLTNGKCLTECPASTYLSLASYSCLPCSSIQGCKLCQSSSKCTLCQAGYNMHNDLCVKNCPAQYEAIQGVCKVVEICQLYSMILNNTKICLSTCPASTYADNSLMSCLPCHSNCLTCRSLTNCLTCRQNRYLLTTSNATHQNNTCQLSCPFNHYIKDNKFCVLCPSTCNTCGLINNIISCFSCPVSLALLDNRCLSTCPKGYYTLVGASGSKTCRSCAPQCASCSNQSTCQECTNKLNVLPSCLSVNCTNGYLNNNNLCSPCHVNCSTCFGGSSNQCLSCSNNMLLINGVCSVTCMTGWVRNGSLCIPCPTNCLNCTLSSSNISQISCLTCRTPFILTNIASKPCVLDCKQLNTVSSSYVNINNACQLCNISNCLTCQLNSANSLTCLECSSTYFNYNSTCHISCPSNTYSVNFTSSMPQKTCILCPSTCLTCNSSACLSCNPTSALPLLLNNNCVAACPEIHYISNNKCLPCSTANCMSCNSNNTCLTCQQPYKLVNNACNACLDGYFMNNESICLTCTLPCQSCNTQLNCLTCIDGYVFFNNSCLINCPSNFILVNGRCQACPSNCQRCSDVNTCVRCNAGFSLLVGSSSSNTSTTTCINNCSTSSGRFIDTTTNICSNCSPNCISCTGLSTCLSCSSSFILYQGVCITTCPSGFTNINQTCLPCLTGCRLCGPTNSYTCLSCSSGYTLLSNGTCIVTPSNCSAGYFLNALNTCSECFSTCKTCNGPQSINCLSCQNGFTLTNNICLQICNINSYLETSSFNCKECSNKFSNCEKCTETSCLSCISTHKLANGVCSLSCTSGTFLSNGICNNCSAFCSVCTSSSNCQTCVNSSVILYMNQCYTTCPVQTYLNAVNNTCVSCSQTCLKCSNSPSNCTQCISPYNLLPENNTCLVNCPQKMYASNNSICLNCSANCLGCVDSSTCVVCSSSYFLINGTCRSTCISGYYIDSSSGRCLQCVQPCLTCTSRTNCSSCKSPTILSNNSCITNCSSGKYWNVNLTSCVNCSITNCSYCDSVQCFSCMNNSYAYHSSNGTISNCIYTCVQGTYPDNVTRTCQKCFQNCQRCTNGSYCSRCVGGYKLFLSSDGGASECLNACPDGYYQLISASNNISTCSACSFKCRQCTNPNTCSQCKLNHFLNGSLQRSVCLDKCPSNHYTPTIIDGSARCGQCPANCSSCIDAVTCSSCVSDYFALFNSQCIPANCVNCLFCNNNICQLCSQNYYLINKRCVSRCPDFFFNETVLSTMNNMNMGICSPCIDQCVWCQNNQTCKLCTSGNVYVNGSGCINQGFANFGFAGNMSGFTSNITQIMSTVYVATSSGPIAFGAVGSTYGVMGFGQALYMLQGASNNNPQMVHFLSSLSSICYINDPNKTSSSQPASSSSTISSRLLQETRSFNASFIQTNIPIFAMIFFFIAIYLACLIFDRYDGCCASCPNLLRYLHHICDFMKKRFKFIYVDTVMWISYMPFLYFAILQLKGFSFENGLHSLSSLLALVIVVVYPIYPFYILKQLFDKSQDSLSNLVNYKAITWKLPPHLSQQEGSLCKNYQCCPKENPDTLVIEMSLSPFIDKVIRPVYNEDIPEYSEFKYFTKDNFKLAIAPLRYIKKFLFVLIVALSTNSLLTLSLLIILTGAFIVYLVVLKPKEKLYLIVQILIQGFLLVFLIFMVMYIADGGSKVTSLSIATHAFGFLIANSALAIAIILNILAYYTIFCCVIDLVKFLKVQVQKDQKMQKKLNDIIDEQKFLEINNVNRDDDDNPIPAHLLLDQKEVNNDKQDIDLNNKKKKKRGDDQGTQENDDDDYMYDQFNLDEQKEYDIRGSINNKKPNSKIINKKKFQENEDFDDQIPNLKLSMNRQKSKKAQVKVQEGSVTSQEMVNSSLTDNDSNVVANGLLRNHGNKYQRDVNKGQLNVQRGQVRKHTNNFKREIGKNGTNIEQGILREPTDNYRKKNQKKNVQEQESQANLFSKNDKKGEFVQDLDTYDRVNNKKKKEQQSLKDLTPYDRQKKSKNSKNSQNNSNQIPQAKFKEQNKSQKNIYDEFDQFTKEPEIKDLKTKDHKSNKKPQNTQNNDLFYIDDQDIPEMNYNQRQTDKKEKNKNTLYKVSDQEQDIAEGKLVQKNRKNFKRNVKNAGESQQKNDIKDINTYDRQGNSKKTPKKGFMQDGQRDIQQAQYRNIQTKKNAKKVIDLDKISQNQRDIQAKTYDHVSKKNLRNNQGNKQQQSIEQGKFVERQKKSVNKPSFFNSLDDNQLVESIEFNNDPRANKSNGKKTRNQEQFEQESNNAKILKRKENPNQKKEKDNKLSVNQDFIESYDDIIKKNKQEIFKNPIKNQRNLLNLEDDGQFQQVVYSRPQSKRENSRDRDNGLKMRSNHGQDSQDESKSIRKQRASAIQKIRSKGNLNIDDKSQNIQSNVSSDSRRISKLQVKKNKVKGGNLNISDLSENQDIQEIRFDK